MRRGFYWGKMSQCPWSVWRPKTQRISGSVGTLNSVYYIRAKILVFFLSLLGFEPGSLRWKANALTTNTQGTSKIQKKNLFKPLF